MNGFCVVPCDKNEVTLAGNYDPAEVHHFAVIAFGRVVRRFERSDLVGPNALTPFQARLAAKYEAEAFRDGLKLGATEAANAAMRIATT